MWYIFIKQIAHLGGFTRVFLFEAIASPILFCILSWLICAHLHYFGFLAILINQKSLGDTGTYAQCLRDILPFLITWEKKNPTKSDDYVPTICTNFASQKTQAEHFYILSFLFPNIAYKKCTLNHTKYNINLGSFWRINLSHNFSNWLKLAKNDQFALHNQIKKCRMTWALCRMWCSGI